MLKKLLNSGIICAVIIVISVSIITFGFLRIKQSNEMIEYLVYEDDLKDIKVNESMRLNTKRSLISISPSSIVYSNSGQKYRFNEIGESENKFLIIFSQFQCESCINIALDKLKRIIPLIPKGTEYYVIGDISNINGFFNMMKPVGISEDRLFYSQSFVNSLKIIEDMPFILNIDNAYRVHDASFLDKHHTNDYYRLFFSLKANTK